ncbi:hypothetical protein BH23ACT5_BH23ACT5_15710 [soil metagenome]
MMPYMAHLVANEKIADAHRRAARYRLQQEAKQAPESVHGVLDAVGHGLIALGSRLVSHQDDHSAPRRAA